jgi:hypothetical protein
MAGERPPGPRGVASTFGSPAGRERLGPRRRPRAQSLRGRVPAATSASRSPGGHATRSRPATTSDPWPKIPGRFPSA